MSPNDALDPGPNGDYPHWPRKPNGEPDPARMPTGLHPQHVVETGERIVTDQTPRTPDGTPIVPPTIPPEEDTE